MSRSFTGIKLVLVVGICGAVPTPPVTEYRSNETDRFLGDVIFGKSIISTDRGWETPNGLVVRESPGSIAVPSRRMMNILSTYEDGANYEALNLSMRSHLSKLILRTSQSQRNPNLFRCPGKEHDRLFPPEYPHIHRPRDPTCSDCQQGNAMCFQNNLDCKAAGCDDRELISRNINGRELAEQVGGDLNPRWHPVIHFGAYSCASSAQLNSSRRDEMAVGRYNAVMAFEMEAAGVAKYIEVPWLVIKGVCSYADEHQTRNWQPWAALTAVAATVAFLDVWNPVRNPQVGEAMKSQTSQSQAAQNLRTTERIEFNDDARTKNTMQQLSKTDDTAVVRLPIPSRFYTFVQNGEGGATIRQKDRSRLDLRE